MGRKVEINYSKVKEISDLGLSIKETLERLHQCNIKISRMQYYRWQKKNVTSKEGNSHTPKTDDNVTLKGRYEVVGLGLKGIDELKGKRFDTLEEIISMGIHRVFIYDYDEGKCLTPIYHLDN